MMSAILKAFAGRAGWLPSLLVLALIALIAFTTVTGLPGIEQNIDKQVRQYLEANLSENDSLVGFQVSGRDVLLSGRIADPALIRAGLMALPGVRGVMLSDSGNDARADDASTVSDASAVSDASGMASPQGRVEPTGEVKLETPEAAVDGGNAEAETSASASVEPSEVSKALLNQSDRNSTNVAAQNTATSTEKTLSDTPSDGLTASASVVNSANPEVQISSLNARLTESLRFMPGDAQISTELGLALLSLAKMMNQNPDLLIGVEGYPDDSVGPDKSAYIGFVRARKAEKFLLEQQVEDGRIFTRYLSNDEASAEDGVQLKFYILK